MAENCLVYRVSTTSELLSTLISLQEVHCMLLQLYNIENTLPILFLSQLLDPSSCDALGKDLSFNIPPSLPPSLSLSLSLFLHDAHPQNLDPPSQTILT